MLAIGVHKLTNYTFNFNPIINQIKLETYFLQWKRKPSYYIGELFDALMSARLKGNYL